VLDAINANENQMGSAMRYIINGQQAFGKSVLEKMLERGDNVVAVFCAPDKGSRADPLKEFALEKGLPVHQPASYKTEEARELVASYEPDLGVMAFVTLFVPEEILYLPKHDTIQYHPSLLPLHRGPSSINWPIVQGSTKTGLSIFWPDNGLDEGPILMQKECEITPDDTLGTVYFDKLCPMGVDAMIESIDLVKEGKAPRIEQDHSKSTYESWFKKDLAEIDWSKPVDEVFNLIRGTNPAPGAWTTLGGKKIDIFDSAKVGGDAGKPGTVTDTTDEGFLVAADGGQILVKRVRPEGEGKIAANEFSIDKGAKLGS
jgi:methionyl-tRNA formyltransferase